MLNASARQMFWKTLGAPMPESDATTSALVQARASGRDEQTVDRALATALGVTIADDLTAYLPSARFIERVPISYARRHGMIGFRPPAADTLSHMGPVQQPMPVALASLDRWEELDVVARYVGQPVEPILARPDQVQAAINIAYQQRLDQTRSVLESLDRRQVLEEVRALSRGEREDLLDNSSRAPVMKLVNLILFEAVKNMASDVHVHPYDDALIVRTRTDGVLFDSHRLPKSLQEEIISRIKVMGRMNIAEKRLPQDGRATVQVGDRLIDLRIASLPTSHGERLVIRLLDKSARLYRLDELGMPPAACEAFGRQISREHGLVLVTGPTGSGKTTTLYAALQQLNRTERNVLTLEDPIEYELAGVSQTQINEKKGMTFARGLRSILRQDPDIIMVGEIRDHETAVMAIQSALTGHLVFSTLHTNDAASAITRLLDLGIEPHLVASSLIGVLAQRLVRCVCRQCAQPLDKAQTREALRKLGLDPHLHHGPMKLQQGVGCDTCRSSGYRGRQGLFELLVVNDDTRNQIQSQATARQIKLQACRTGMRTLYDEGVAKVLSGITTVDEVVRITTSAAPEMTVDAEPAVGSIATDSTPSFEEVN